MNAALALPLPIDARSVAPEDWQYLADLLGSSALPTPRPALRLVKVTSQHGDRRFKIRPATSIADWRLYRAPPSISQAARLRQQKRERNPPPTFTFPRARDLSPAQNAAIDHAVRIAGRDLALDRKQDLRQTLAITLLTDTPPNANLEAWLVVCARNRVAGGHRLEDRRREILASPQAREFLAPRDPHPGAMEDALIGWIDNGGTGLKRRVPLPEDQEEIALKAIRDKRTRAYKSTAATPARASSSLGTRK